MGHDAVTAPDALCDRIIVALARVRSARRRHNTVQEGVWQRRLDELLDAYPLNR